MRRRGISTLLGVLPTLLLSLPLPAQEREMLHLSAGTTGEVSVPLVRHRGFPAVPLRALRTAGWRVESTGGSWVATLPGGERMEIRPGAPFVRLDTSWAQLVEAPYALDDSLFLPLQLLTDLLPDRYPRFYQADGSRALGVLEASLWRAGFGEGSTGARPPTTTPSEEQATATPPVRQEPVTPVPLPEDDGVRVVIIDAGHGGVDPGALGRRRTREKDVTLAVALALAEELKGDPLLEVHLTRDKDVLVPIWERGEIATRLKGDRPGIFLSIHANSVTQRNVRGVETYFLSEARTEHEARVAALENSAMELERGRPAGPGQGELGAIISELLNLDFQHWSSDLAARIQGELARVHPGPDRGVKQAPLAVLTNAMMPSVLIEVGFITNPVEEETIGDPDFHRDAARAIAQAVREFFQRYPPGGTQSQGAR